MGQSTIWKVGGPAGKAPRGNSFHVIVAGIGKTSNNKHRFNVANEALCLKLAQALLLPIPPGFVSDFDGNPCFVSVNVRPDAQSVPAAKGDEIVAQDHSLACGICLFDVWIANDDRHDDNIFHDRTTGEILIFDHGHSFYANHAGRTYLEEIGDVVGFQDHLLSKHVSDWNAAELWNERISAVPEFMVKGAVSDAVRAGLPAEDETLCVEFLLTRRRKLLDLVNSDQAMFPKLRRPE